MYSKPIVQPRNPVCSHPKIPEPAEDTGGKFAIRGSWNPAVEMRGKPCSLSRMQKKKQIYNSSVSQHETRETGNINSEECCSRRRRCRSSSSTSRKWHRFYVTLLGTSGSIFCHLFAQWTDALHPPENFFSFLFSEKSFAFCSGAPAHF